MAESDSPSPPRGGSLAAKAVRGTAWNVSTSIGGRAIGLIGTLVLTRFLAPAEYGEVSVAIVIATTLNILTSPGFGQYIVAVPKFGRDVVFHAAAFHIGVGWLVVAAFLLLRHPIAALFHMPNLASLFPVLAIALAIDRLGYIPSRVLVRDMRFGVLGMATFAAEVTYTVVAVGLAWRGWGADAVKWAFVARVSVSALIHMASIQRKAWLSPARLSGRTLRKMLDFGLPMTGANVLHWTAHRGDNLLIAGMFGPAAVGQYNFAYNIANIPATHVGEGIGDVLLPTFATLESTQEKHRALIRASGLLALVVFPLAVGLGAIARTLVQVLLDPRWAAVAPMLMILSGLSIFRPVGWMVQSYLQSVKRTRTLLMLETLKSVLVLGLIWVLGQWGVLMACIAIGVAFGANALASQYVVNRVDGIGMWSLTRPYLGPLIACAPIVGAVLGVRSLVGVVTWWSLILEIVAGGVAYIVSAQIVAREPSRDFLRLIRNAVGWPRRLAAV